MNENDKPRPERRRSSRRGRRGAGGGDRSAPAAPQAPQAAQNQQGQRQNNGQPSRQGRGGSARGERSDRDRQDRSRTDRNGRAAEASRSQGDSGNSRRGQRGAAGGRGTGGTNPSPGQSRPAQAPRERQNLPKLVSPVLPKPLCPRCGTPIEDLPTALTDKETGEPIHFDCVLARLSESEPLAEGEKIVYLGGGQFGVVRFDNPSDLKHFRVRKTLQWEEKDKRAEWRRAVTELYSST